LETDHSTQLKKETDALKKDKEVTVNTMNENHSNAIKEKEENHKATV